MADAVELSNRLFCNIPPVCAYNTESIGIALRFVSKDVSFVAALTRAQFELKVYITTLAGSLQETNVYIWRKADTYDPS